MTGSITIKSNESGGRYFPAAVMENDYLLAWIDVYDGGRLTRLYDKRHDCELIWTNKRTQFMQRFYAANYDDTSNSGIEEAFPTVGSCIVDGVRLPFFGEIWSVPWQAEIIEEQGVQKVQLRCNSSIYPAEILKTFSFGENGHSLIMEYIIHNIGAGPMKYVFGIHPSLTVWEDSRIYLPQGEYILNYAYPDRTLEGARIKWPTLMSHDLTYSLPFYSNCCFNPVAMPVSKGEYSIMHPGKRCGIRICFDETYFRTLSVWLIYGGWRGHYCVMSEFFTSWPSELDNAISKNLACSLAIDEKRYTKVEYNVIM